MTLIDTVINWYTESPYERGLLTFGILNAVVKQTPWKGDDDIVDALKGVFLGALGMKKERRV